MNSFLFLGGDTRMLYAAKRLGRRYECAVYGFNQEAEADEVPLVSEISRHNNIILPLPSSRDGVNINAPLFSEKIPLSIIPEAVYKGGVIYCGGINPALEKICAEHDLRLIDYFGREELAVRNAVLTAEGCIEILMKERGIALFGANILLTGFGRISKILARYLYALGAKVTVAARKSIDLISAEILGVRAVRISETDTFLPDFDFVINTVPAPIFSTRQIKKLGKACLFVDLASVSGLEAPEQAESEGLNYIFAQSLPGKVAPITAGEIIADTILSILTEDYENSENSDNRKLREV